MINELIAKKHEVKNKSTRKANINFSIDTSLVPIPMISDIQKDLNLLPITHTNSLLEHMLEKEQLKSQAMLRVKKNKEEIYQDKIRKYEEKIIKQKARESKYVKQCESRDHLWVIFIKY